MTKRFFLIITSILIYFALFAGCSKSETLTASNLSAEHKNITMTILGEKAEIIITFTGGEKHTLTGTVVKNPAGGFKVDGKDGEGIIRYECIKDPTTKWTVCTKAFDNLAFVPPQIMTFR